MNSRPGLSRPSYDAGMFRRARRRTSMRPFTLAHVAIGLTLSVSPGARALDHAPWDRVLRAHANGGGVDYAGHRADAAAQADLARFLGDVATMPADEPLSSWINAYNAIVVASVLEAYPISSVRDVPGFF